MSREEGEDFDSLLILSSFLYLSLQFLPTALTLLFSLQFLVLSPEVHIPLVSVCRTLMIPGYITDQTLCLFNLCRTRKKGIILLVARSFFYFLDISVLPSPPVLLIIRRSKPADSSLTALPFLSNHLVKNSGDITESNFKRVKSERYNGFVAPPDR